VEEGVRGIVVSDRCLAPANDVSQRIEDLGDSNGMSTVEVVEGDDIVSIRQRCDLGIRKDAAADDLRR
jgi:hypothetical protein